MSRVGGWGANKPPEQPPCIPHAAEARAPAPGCCSSPPRLALHAFPPAEVRKEFSFQARRLVTFALLMLEAVHCFACLNWLILRVQHFPQGAPGAARCRSSVAWARAVS